MNLKKRSQTGTMKPYNGRASADTFFVPLHAIVIITKGIKLCENLNLELGIRIITNGLKN